MSNFIVSLQTRDSQYQRVIEAASHDVNLADSQTGADSPLLRLEIVGDDRVRVLNLTDLPIHCGDVTIDPGGGAESLVPCQLDCDTATIHVIPALARESLYRGCQRMPTVVHDGSSDVLERARTPQSDILPVVEIARSPSPETLSSWFSTLALIQRQASCTKAFYAEAVAALVDPGGLETGMLLERGESGWSIAHFGAASQQTPLFFQPELAELAYRRRETVIYHADQVPPDDRAIQGASFAAPVFDEEMRVAYVLYGHRQLGATNRRRRFRELEARWIQLVAEAVSSGLIRLSQESSLARQRLLLERSYPPEVAKLLSGQLTPQLDAEDREVTVMFVDLVNSTKLCRIGSCSAYLEFQSDVMDRWTSIIGRNAGSIVDYYGDGLIAMWNAPTRHSNHAIQACQAGLDILEELSIVNSTWAQRLGHSIRVSIGVNTGTASVGNAGSNERLKYGPRGAVVNLASRIEHATRSVQQSFLISDATRQQLPDNASAFRLGQFRLRGFDDPVVLHALHSLDAETPTNSCCLAKYCLLQRQLQNGDIAAASDCLSNCQSCEFDELSLQFVHEQLLDISREAQRVSTISGLIDLPVAPIFDLSHS